MLPPNLIFQRFLNVKLRYRLWLAKGKPPPFFGKIRSRVYISRSLRTRIILDFVTARLGLFYNFVLHFQADLVMFHLAGTVAASLYNVLHLFSFINVWLLALLLLCKVVDMAPLKIIFSSIFYASFHIKINTVPYLCFCTFFLKHFII